MYKIFIQSEFLPDVCLIEVEPDTTPTGLRDHLFGILKDRDCSDIGVYLEDCDDECPLDTLDAVSDGLRFHLHRLKSIDVSVHYAGRCVSRSFRPGTTVARVKRWAAREFGVSPSDAVDLSLQVSGTDQRPDSDTHIGSLIEYPCRDLSFDLVPSPRING